MKTKRYCIRLVRNYYDDGTSVWRAYRTLALAVAAAERSCGTHGCVDLIGPGQESDQYCVQSGTFYHAEENVWYSPKYVRGLTSHLRSRWGGTMGYPNEHISSPTYTV